MDSLKQFFSYMNDINFKYVVLRNWEKLPYDVQLGEHSDLDLLVYDFDHFREIFPSAKLEFPFPRVRMKMPVAESYIYMDIRHIGDDYYPEDFEKAILETREYNELGFFTPNPIHHRIALAYHAVHHKNSISKEYRRHLGDAQINELLEALKQSNVGWVVPKDTTVGHFNGYWKGATSVVMKSELGVTKTQTGYMRYPLNKNERWILLYALKKSDHFPKFMGSNSDEKEITIEDCGEPLSMDNMPPDWRPQLDLILLDLKASGVQHRDIKMDNLMVKDGVIKLIDFGWAVTFEKRGAEFSEIEDNPPSCLGFPNRPSEGFSDAFSMRRVIKQIEYELEEKELSCAS